MSRYRQSERQSQVNLHFGEELVEVKTQSLFLAQALGSVVDLLDGLLDRLVVRRVLKEDDPIITTYRKALENVRKSGLYLSAPEDPDAPVEQIKCPVCDAVLKVKAGKKIERCDWCGYEFD